MVGLRSQNHTLNLAISVVDIEVECEECGESISIPKRAYGDLLDFIICSTCSAENRHRYRLKKLKENHRQRLVDEEGKPIRIPPTIHIDTRDLPGLARDDVAKRIGETFSLFKQK